MFAQPGTGKGKFHLALVYDLKPGINFDPLQGFVDAQIAAHWTHHLRQAQQPIPAGRCVCVQRHLSAGTYTHRAVRRLQRRTAPILVALVYVELPLSWHPS